MNTKIELTKTQSVILDLIKGFGDNGATPKQLAQSLSKNTVTVQIHLKALLDLGLIEKNGNHPYIYYKVATDLSTPINSLLTREELEIAELESRLAELKSRANNQSIIEANYAYITPDGQYLTGQKGFDEWLTNQKPGISLEQKNQLIVSYEDQINQIKKIKDSKLNLIEATSKLFELAETPTNVFLDKLYYCDKFSIPIFGRTKIAIQTFQAKMNSDKNLANRVIPIIDRSVTKLIETYNLNAVCFIPPSIDRKFQFMKYLEKQLEVDLPKIHLQKEFKGNTPIQQKNLKTQVERVINATNTFRVSGIDDELIGGQKIDLLLIDDFVGSGASMNIVAKKIRSVYPGVDKIIGLAVTGNVSKGFEVVKNM